MRVHAWLAGLLIKGKGGEAAEGVHIVARGAGVQQIRVGGGVEAEGAFEHCADVARWMVESEDGSAVDRAWLGTGAARTRDRRATTRLALVGGRRVV